MGLDGRMLRGWKGGIPWGKTLFKIGLTQLVRMSCASSLILNRVGGRIGWERGVQFHCRSNGIHSEIQ